MDLKHFSAKTETDGHNHIRDRRIELKFILSKSLSQRIRRWAEARMDADPHCTSLSGHSYDIHTLYLDTQNLDLYRNTGLVGITKHRLRRYGEESHIWIETKRKKKDVVQKQRTQISVNELGLLTASIEDTPAWNGSWFQQRVAERALRPATLVHYQRYARIASHQNRTIRLTIDSEITGCRSAHWEVPGRREPLADLSPDAEILELKFYEVLPPLFKQLLLEFPILSTGFSKYRTAMNANECLAGQPVSLEAIHRSSS